MDIKETIVITFVVILLLSISYAVLGTAKDIRDSIEEPKKQRPHLPSECAEFYNDGTEAWVECMGVQYV